MRVARLIDGEDLARCAECDVIGKFAGEKLFSASGQFGSVPCDFDRFGWFETAICSWILVQLGASQGSTNAACCQFDLSRLGIDPRSSVLDREPYFGMKLTGRMVGPVWGPQCHPADND